MKKSKNLFKIIIVILILCIYPVYAIIVFFSSKSPNSLSEFPTESVYWYSTNDFAICIDLDCVEDKNNVLEEMSVTAYVKQTDLPQGFRIEPWQHTPSTMVY